MRRMLIVLIAGLIALQSIFAVSALAAEGLIANAGADVTVRDDDGDGVEAVTLDGSGSSHTAGIIASFEWFTTGGTVPIASGITAPVALAPGVHGLTLVVTDEQGATANDGVVVTVLQQGVNPAPVASAGPDRIVRDEDGDGVELVTLDGSDSADSFGTIVAYEWFDGSGTNSPATGAIVELALAAGDYTFVLVVTDNEGASGNDTVAITVLGQGVNPAPVADAGLDQITRDNDGDGAEAVSLDASGSFDPFGAIVSYEWFESGQTLATGVSAAIALGVGEHTITLTVTDDEGAAGSDEVLVTVLAQGVNLAPVANAGSDQTVGDADGDGFATVSLDGSGSTDPFGTIVSYEWSEGGVPIATGPTAAVALSVGEHVISLVVTDDEGATASDEAAISVVAGSLPPDEPQDPLAGLPDTAGGHALRILLTQVLPNAPEAARAGLLRAIQNLADRLGIDISGIVDDLIADDDADDDDADDDRDHHGRGQGHDADAADEDDDEEIDDDADDDEDVADDDEDDADDDVDDADEEDDDDDHAGQGNSGQGNPAGQGSSSGDRDDDDEGRRRGRR